MDWSKAYCLAIIMIMELS